MALSNFSLTGNPHRSIYDMNFLSHHPMHHKLRVVRILLDHSNSVLTDPKDIEFKKKSRWASDGAVIQIGHLKTGQTEDGQQVGQEAEQQQ